LIDGNYISAYNNNIKSRDRRFSRFCCEARTLWAGHVAVHLSRDVIRRGRRLLLLPLVVVLFLSTHTQRDRQIWSIGNESWLICVPGGYRSTGVGLASVPRGN